jgi:hypothetical protein
MSAIGSVGYSWGLNRNLWVFLRNAIEQHRRVEPPLPREPVMTPGHDLALEKDGHIDLQA